MAKRGASTLEVIYEDNHLLVVNKPAMLATMGVTEGTASVVTEVKRYLKTKYQKPGNVYVGVVSRLDTAVTGVLVLARTSKAAARLSEQFRESKAKKTYWAAVENRPAVDEDSLVHWVSKDEKLRRMTIVKPHSVGAQKARLSYRLRQSNSKAAWLEVMLETGRKHQIRLQLSEVGCPILGDRKYGGRKPFPLGIALHARRLVIEHPTSHESLAFEAPVPASWRQLGFTFEKGEG
jgi:23S rRNA pseudouridine1911/1915/1917 synthase